VFTPFSVLSVFLAMTRELTESERTRMAFRTILAVGVVSVALLLVGRGLFSPSASPWMPFASAQVLCFF